MNIHLCIFYFCAKIYRYKLGLFDLKRFRQVLCSPLNSKSYTILNRTKQIYITYALTLQRITTVNIYSIAILMTNTLSSTNIFFNSHSLILLNIPSTIQQQLKSKLLTSCRDHDEKIVHQIFFFSLNVNFH